MKLTWSAKPSNQQIADNLELIAAVLTAENANRFRIRAYQNAAETIRDLEESIWDLATNIERLKALPNIGPTIAQKLFQLKTDGQISAFDEYVAHIPAGFAQLLKLEGVGPKHAYLLAHTFRLDDADTAYSKLKEAAETNQIQSLEGFGEKSQAEILQAITSHSKKNDRIPYKTASQLADSIIEQLITSNAVTKAEPLGSLRRQEKTVGDIDIGLQTDDMGRVKRIVKSMKGVKRIMVAGDQSIRFLTDQGYQVDLKTVPVAEWGAFLQHFTGSKTHNVKLREYARQKGLSLSEHGIKNLATGQLTPVADESDFYHQLGLKWIPPQERLGTTELENYRLK